MDDRHRARRRRIAAITPLFVVLLGAAVAAGCGGDGGSASAEDASGEPAAVEVDAEMISKGQEIYTRNCAPCHGPLGKGDGPASATLNPSPRDHSNREYMDTLADQDIADTVQMGGAPRGYPNMPSSPHIRGQDMIALVAFVRSLSRGGDGVDAVRVRADR